MTMSKKNAFALLFIVLFIANIAAFTSDIDVNLFNTQTLPLPDIYTGDKFNADCIISSGNENKIFVKMNDYEGIFYYAKNSQSIWEYNQLITVSDSITVSEIGSSMCYKNNRLFATAAADTQNVVYVFENNSNNWKIIQRIEIPEEFSESWQYRNFGELIKTNGNDLVIGYSGYEQSYLVYYQLTNGKFEYCTSIVLDMNVYDLWILENSLLLSVRWYCREYYNGLLLFEVTDSTLINRTWANYDEIPLESGSTYLSFVDDNKFVAYNNDNYYLFEHDNFNLFAIDTLEMDIEHLNFRSQPYSSGDNVFIGKYWYYIENDMFKEHGQFSLSQSEELISPNVIYNYYDGIVWTMEFPDFSANFEADTNITGTGRQVSFHNLSKQAEYFEWDLDGDGTIDSYEENPVFSYTQPGTYSVTLTISNDSNTHTLTKYDFIKVQSVHYEYDVLDLSDWPYLLYDYQLGWDLHLMDQFLVFNYEYYNVDSWVEGYSLYRNVDGEYEYAHNIRNLWNHDEKYYFGKNKILIVDDSNVLIDTRSEDFEENEVTVSSEIIYFEDNFAVGKSTDDSLLMLHIYDVDNDFYETQSISIGSSDTKIADISVCDNKMFVSFYDRLIEITKTDNSWLLSDEIVNPNEYGKFTKIAADSNSVYAVNYVTDYVVFEYYNLEVYKEFESGWFNTQVFEVNLATDLIVQSSSHIAVSESYPFCNPVIFKKFNNGISLPKTIDNGMDVWGMALNNDFLALSVGFEILLYESSLFEAEPPTDILVPDDDPEEPDSLIFTQISNYPNPFNPSTTFAYSIPKSGDVEIAVYNLKGQKVTSLVNDYIEQGNHRILWEGKDSNNKNVSSGVYFYQLKLNGKALKTSKCVLLK